MAESLSALSLYCLLCGTVASMSSETRHFIEDIDKRHNTALPYPYPSHMLNLNPIRKVRWKIEWGVFGTAAFCSQTSGKVDFKAYLDNP